MPIDPGALLRQSVTKATQAAQAVREGADKVPGGPKGAPLPAAPQRPPQPAPAPAADGTAPPGTES